jgi:hypothetical protein
MAFSEIHDGGDLLIVKGASSTDDLADLGVPFAHRFQRAKTVVLVPENGLPRIVKGNHLSVSFVDTDSRSSRVALVMNRIYRAYVEANPDREHIAHEVVGRFIYYTMADEVPLTRRMIDLIADGEIDLLERCVEQFIDAGFDLALASIPRSGGDDPPGAAVKRRRGDSPAPEASADVEDDGVPVAQRDGEDVLGDRG